MTEDQVKAIFLLAGIEVQKLHELKNGYGSESYRGPWWLVKTEWGLIQIGWRKRVISIDWEDTGLRIDEKANREYEFHKYPITQDNTTMWNKGIHAWGYGKAVEYLGDFKLRMGQYLYATSPEGMRDLADRKEEYLERERIRAENIAVTHLSP